MPRSKTRKKPAYRQPDLSKPIAQNLTEAEALDLNVAFRWRGVDFVVDLSNIQHGRGWFAIRVMSNDNLPLPTRMNAMLDALESAVGQEQLIKAQEVAPDLFDNEQTAKSFWETFTKAVEGMTPGESKAS